MKTCSVIGCNNPVWGKGLCQKHSPKTPLKKTAKKYPIIKKNKEEGITFHVGEELYKKLGKVFGYSTTDRNNFFLSIWNIRPHRCEICDTFLGKEPRSYMFDHLLEKSKYPELEFEPDNIALVCLDCHDGKTRGYTNETYKNLIENVKKKFNIS